MSNQIGTIILCIVFFTIAYIVGYLVGKQKGGAELLHRMFLLDPELRLIIRDRMNAVQDKVYGKYARKE